MAEPTVTPSALEQLWAKLAQKGDLPALGRSVQLVAQLTESDQAKLDALAAVILRDAALASRVLRLANSAAYRRSNAGEVTTIARALVVLGFDTVRNLALTAAVFDRLGEQLPAMQQVLAKALFSALFAEALAGRWQVPRDPLFLGTLFRHLGALLVHYHLPEESERIAALVAAGLPRSKAEQQVLGVSCAALGLYVAKEWGLPTAVVTVIETPAGPAPRELAAKSAAAIGWLASVAETVGAQIAETGGSVAEARQLLNDRFPFLRALTPAQWQAIGEESGASLRHWWQALVGNSLPSRFAAVVGDQPAVGTSASGVSAPSCPPAKAATPERDEQADPAVPFDPDLALARLATGLEELTQTLFERQPWNVVGYLACEVVWRALRCERVMVLVRRQRLLLPAAGIAPEWSLLKKKGWGISLDGPPDVFQLAIGRGVDIEIDDRNAPTLAGKIPEALLCLPRGVSVLLLPLKGSSTEAVPGLLYCDKPLPHQLRLPPALKAMLRQWRNLVAMAWRDHPA